MQAVEITKPLEKTKSLSKTNPYMLVLGVESSQTSSSFRSVMIDSLNQKDFLMNELYNNQTEIVTCSDVFTIL